MPIVVLGLWKNRGKTRKEEKEGERQGKGVETKNRLFGSFFLGGIFEIFP
jgi:hypothetical protein